MVPVRAIFLMPMGLRRLISARILSAVPVASNILQYYFAPQVPIESVAPEDVQPADGGVPGTAAEDEASGGH